MDGFGGRLLRKSLAEQVEEAIARHILTKELGAGAPLPSIAGLAAEFGVSRPVVREALTSLEAKGIVTIVNGKTATVSPVTSDVLREYFDRVLRQRADSMAELLEVRRGLEIQAIVLAAQRREPEDLAALHDLLAQMRQALGDPAHYAELETRFHLAIAAAARNRLLYHLVESMRECIRQPMREGLQLTAAKGDLPVVHAKHEVLVDCIEQGDTERAAREMDLHLGRSFETRAAP
jgi:DNA-binding FadR family transcriptional regulator